MKLRFADGATKYTKSELLECLYDKKMEMKVHIDQGEYIKIVDVDLIGVDGKPDCLIGSFSENWYVRAPKGERAEEYTSMAGLLGAIEKEIEKIGRSVYKLQILKYGTKELVCEFTQ